MRIRLLFLPLALSMPGALTAETVVRHPLASSRLILEGVTVNPGAQTLLLSGRGPALLDPADPKAGYGDTQAQTESALKGIGEALARQGFAFSDVVKLTIYIVADRNLGKPDYAGMNAGFRKYFGSADNPQTVARSAVEVAGIQFPGMLVEIEAVAARDAR